MNEVTVRKSLANSMAARYDMEPVAFVNAIKATVIKGQVDDNQFAAFLMVAKEYELNPLTKEIYAFPDRGGIVPIVSVDGWAKLINNHPAFDGMEFQDHLDGGKTVAITCRMYRKDRARPIEVTEYLSECVRPTEPWKKWPARMLRHKAMIQCARYAFGFSGIMEPDEYERMVDITPPAEPTIAARFKTAAPAEVEDAREGFSASHVEIHTAAVVRQAEAESDIIDYDPETGEVPQQGASPSPQEDAVDPPSDPADAAASSDEQLEWLANVAKFLWAVTEPGGEIEILVTQRKLIPDTYPKPEGTEKRISDKAASIYSYCKQVVDGALDREDAAKIVSGIAGIDMEDL